MGAILATRSPTVAPTLPVGVTLQAIDGETMTSSTTMSNNYYARNGYTYAASSSYNAGKSIWCAGYSWDDPRFFPLAVFFGIYPEDADDFITLKMNTCIACTGETTGTDISNRGIWVFGDTPTYGAYTAALYTDEPGSDTTIETLILSTPDATQNGRMWAVTWTWAPLQFGGIGARTMVEMYTENEFNTPTHPTSLGWITDDVYWFAVSTTGPAGDFWTDICGDLLSTAGDAVEDQMARGSNYGNMVDVMRSWCNGSNSGSLHDITHHTSQAAARIPVFSPWIENYDGNVGEGDEAYRLAAHHITPPEFNWAVWSSLIHGARGIGYFVYVNDHTGGQFSHSIQAGQSISMWDQAIVTNNLIISLAPVLNSPFALNYLTAVSPNGYLFPAYESGWLNGGIEACVKWYGNKFYIFATTRYSRTVTGTSATFTLNSNVTSTQVTVLGESRTISISGHQFTDTFANAWTVHIYRVD